MPKLLLNRKDIIPSKQVKKYNRRELLSHLVEIKRRLDLVESFIQGLRQDLVNYKNGKMDAWGRFELMKDIRQEAFSHACYQHCLARIAYIERRLKYVLH